jgi:hypothetical protein
LPDPEVQEFLPDTVKVAIVESGKAAATLAELATIVHNENSALADARRRDTAERTDLIVAGKADPGPKHTERVQQQVDEARKHPPIAEELFSRSV